MRHDRRGPDCPGSEPFSLRMSDGGNPEALTGFNLVPDARDHHVSFAPRFEVCPAWSGARRVTDRTVGLSAYLYGAIHALVSGDEDDLAGDASLSEQFVRLSRLGKRKSPRDQRLDLSLLKEIEQGDQVLVKLSRSQPLEP